MTWRKWAAFAVLCGWLASEWLLEAAPDGPSMPERQGIASGVVALLGVWLVFWGRKRHDRSRLWNRRRLCGALALAGLLYFAIPAIVLDLAKAYASEINVTVIFALAPVAVVLAWGAVTNERLGGRLLISVVCGIAGLLFLLPFEGPESVHGWESLTEAFIAMLLVACAGVWLNRLAAAVEFPEVLAIVGAVNAVVLLGWCWARWPVVWGWSAWGPGVWIGILSGGISIALTIWLLRVMAPVRFSARFFVIPLVTILEGLLLVRPEISGRLVLGVTLLTAGAAGVLASRGAVEEEILTLR
jgi:drug/metabolite transporter (DMT)-like permease